MTVQNNSNRLFFIDAIRAWAILMMLQGHFIDGLLDPYYRDGANLAYKTWLYFRGITAPVFFTVSGFIFTYLLMRAPTVGRDNPRVKKGLEEDCNYSLLAIYFVKYFWTFSRTAIHCFFSGRCFTLHWFVHFMYRCYLSPYRRTT